MRSLLLSECEIIRAMIGAAAPLDLCNLYVVKEEYAPPRMDSKRWFNTDFSIWLHSDIPPKSQRSVHLLPLRENSIGAEFFAVVRNDGTPVLLELIAGESLSRSSFTSAIDSIDDAMRGIHTPVWDGSVHDLPFLRIVETNTAIIFAAATSVQIATLARLPQREVKIARGRLVIRTGDDGKVLVDGLINCS